MKSLFTSLAGVAIVLFSGSCHAAASTQTYKLIGLGTPNLHAPYDNSSASGLNNLGQAVGKTSEIAYPRTHATLWSAANPSDIGSLGAANGKQSYATGINDAGTIVGNADYKAMVWSGNVAKELVGVGGVVASNASAINNAGQIVGTSRNGRATLWSGESIVDLGTIGGSFSGASALNNVGQIVGSSSPTGDPTYHTGIPGSPGFSVSRATLWNGGVATDLGTLGGFGSFANGINDAGLVVGTSATGALDRQGNPIFHAVLWTSAGIFDLHAANDMNFRSDASGINSAGQIVGRVNGRATIWNGVSATDLNSLLDDSSPQNWILNYATAINVRGEIVGSGTNLGTGQSEAFLLTPVPEPQAYALMLAGLGLIAGIARRRCKQQ